MPSYKKLRGFIGLILAELGTLKMFCKQDMKSLIGLNKIIFDEKFRVLLRILPWEFSVRDKY